MHKVVKSGLARRQEKSVDHSATIEVAAIGKDVFSYPSTAVGRFAFVLQARF